MPGPTPESVRELARTATEEDIDLLISLVRILLDQGEEEAAEYLLPVIRLRRG